MSEKDPVSINDNESLISYILEENEGLKTTLEKKNIIGAAFILRKWVSKVANMSVKELLFEFEDPVFAFNIFTKKLGGVWCGGAATFYAMILRLFGIPAITYGYFYNSEKNLSHVTTLFCDISDKEMPIYLSDAYLNYHYVDSKTGRLITFYDLITRIRSEQYNTIRMEEWPVSRSFLSLQGTSPENEIAYSWCFSLDEPIQKEQSHSGLVEYKNVSPTFSRLLEGAWKDLLEKHRGTRPVEHFLFNMILMNSYFESFSFTNPNVNLKFRELITEIRPDLPDSMNLKAERKFQNGEREEAKSIFLKLIERWPTFSPAYNNLGVICWEAGDIQQALNYFAKALELAPNDRVVVLNCVKVLMDLQRVEDAKKLYSDYLRENPPDVEISQVLGDFQMQQYISLEMSRDTLHIPIVSVRDLHKKLGFETPINYPKTSLEKPLNQWKMEIDDAPIFRYIYRNFRPRRHLEFGTWQGTGVVYCLEECDATVWTINLPFGENKKNGYPAYAHYPEELPSVREWAKKIGLPEKATYRTDSIGFIGRRYLEKELGHRVCQIYCDSRKWDISNYPPGFFDTILIDGGHTKDIVINDTRKAFQLLRQGGIVMWHDFCPPVFKQFECTRGVMEAISHQWDWVNSRTNQLFWIYPSWILLGVKK